MSTAFIALLALWVLARIRFPDQPAASTPVQPLLTQLGAGRTRLDDLATEVTQLRPRVEPFMAGPALRIRNDAAVMLVEDSRSSAAGPVSSEVIALDRASHLAVIRAPFLPAPPPVPWNPSDPGQARFLIATDTSTGVLALRGVLVGSLVPTPSPLWPDPVWLLPAGTGLATGSFVFTADALLAGLVVEITGRPAIVPGTTLLAEAERLLGTTATEPGTLGVEVQALTPAVAKATGAATGIVVAWVDPEGPAADALATGDILEAADGEPLSMPAQWEARTARLSAGSSLAVRVRRENQVRDVTLVAAPAADRAVPTLGLTLISAPDRGSVITAVEGGSTADRAGLKTGDVITLAGDIKAPSPAAIRRTFDRASDGTAVLVAYVRGGAHAVTALEK